MQLFSIYYKVKISGTYVNFPLMQMYGMGNFIDAKTLTIQFLQSLHTQN